jgi:hypothetical protein
MESRPNLLGALRRARERVSTGESAGLLDAVSSLREEVRGPVRDLVYLALLETVMLARGNASLAGLAEPGARESLSAIFDATIRRVSAALH